MRPVVSVSVVARLGQRQVTDKERANGGTGVVLLTVTGKMSMRNLCSMTSGLSSRSCEPTRQNQIEDNNLVTYLCPRARNATTATQRRIGYICIW